MTENEKTMAREATPQKRFHKADPSPSQKRDVPKETPKDQPYLFTDWASI